MPSEAESLLHALARPRAAFRSAVAATLEQVRGVLTAERGATSSEEEAGELGPFAAGRISTERFTALLTHRHPLDGAALERMEAAFSTLSDVATHTDQLMVVHVPPGGSVREEVAAALASLGRAFGAARLFDLARSGRARAEEHGPLLTGLPFRRWNRTERSLAPPLVVFVNGPDCFAEGLAEFLDGAFKVVLVVRGDAPLAPLARLVTPGTFVLQTSAEEDLARLGEAWGPGIAALVPETAAHFMHDPAAGKEPWDRIAITSLPAAAPPPLAGGRSASQQRDDLAHLQALAKRPEAAPAVPAGNGAVPVAAAAGQPADRLAAWLLSNARLEDLG